jgi:gamma-tubulin complex component 4
MINVRANYFLQRNGEFSLSLIREIERLKLSRLTNRSGATSMIREQDLNLALLRASLGTTAQHDPSLSHLRFSLPSGPIRPLLPSLSTVNPKSKSKSTNPLPQEATQFDDLLLGTRLHLTYTVSWPLDLFLHPSDLQIYAALFSYLSSLRKTHTRIHTCWASLSNAQRARRRWTGLGEGGTAEDVEVRRGLLRCGWGVVRDMGWFLDTLLGYVMTHVVDVEFRRLKELLGNPGGGITKSGSAGNLNAPAEGKDATSSSTYLDFTTLRNIHTTYLERLLTGCLLSNPALTAIIRPIFEVCERFVAQVERWGGDVLPALLFEGSLAGDGADSVGALVKERWAIVAEINGVIIIYLRRLPILRYSYIYSKDLTHPFRSILRTIIPLHLPTTLHSHARCVKIDPHERKHC